MDGRQQIASVSSRSLKWFGNVLLGQCQRSADTGNIVERRFRFPSEVFTGRRWPRCPTKHYTLAVAHVCSHACPHLSSCTETSRTHLHVDAVDAVQKCVFVAVKLSLKRSTSLGRRRGVRVRGCVLWVCSSWYSTAVAMARRFNSHKIAKTAPGILQLAAFGAWLLFKTAHSLARRRAVALAEPRWVIFHGIQRACGGWID